MLPVAGIDLVYLVWMTWDSNVLACSGIRNSCARPACATDLSHFRLVLKTVAKPRASRDFPFLCTLCRDLRRPSVTSLYATCPCGAVTFSALT